MTNLYRDYGLEFVPFRLRVENAGSARSYIGGAPPTGVSPPKVHQHTRHFGTLGLEEGIDVSMFGTFDYSAPTGEFDFFSKTGALLGLSSPLIQFVVHAANLPKAKSSPLRGEIQALGLVFGSPRFDPPCTTVAGLGLVDIYTSHKAGGIPFFDQLDGDVGGALNLLGDGFVHLLQLSSLGKDDSIVPGNWFFGETTFHVFARKDNGSFDFRYIWR